VRPGTRGAGVEGEDRLHSVPPPIFSRTGCRNRRPRCCARRAWARGQNSSAKNAVVADGTGGQAIAAGRGAERNASHTVLAVGRVRAGPAYACVRKGGGWACLHVSAVPAAACKFLPCLAGRGRQAHDGCGPCAHLHSGPGRRFAPRRRWLAARARSGDRGRRLLPVAAAMW
jgi:hypothetical protein